MPTVLQGVLCALQYSGAPLWSPCRCGCAISFGCSSSRTLQPLLIRVFLPLFLIPFPVAASSAAVSPAFRVRSVHADNARGCPHGFVELGELCRVHRGQVTGANNVWIADHLADTELPESVLFPSVTKARELIAAAGVLSDASKLRRVVDLPEDLDTLDSGERRAVHGFLRRAKRLGAHQGYIARHRRAWWSLKLRQPAPILGIYMARRRPAFVRNLASFCHINIAHGLYPREPLTERALSGLVDHLAVGTNVIDGRTYAGGLTKFEPREMERLFVPGLDVLETATV